MVTKQKLLYQLEFIEILRDIPNTSEGFRSVVFVVFEIPGLRSISTPWC